MNLNSYIKNSAILCVFLIPFTGCGSLKKDRLPKGYYKITTMLQTDDEKCNEIYKLVHDNLYISDQDSCKHFKLYDKINFSCIYGLTKSQVIILFGKESAWEGSEMLYVFSNVCSAKGTLKEYYRTYNLRFDHDTICWVGGSTFGRLE